MATDSCLAALVRRAWLLRSPLADLVSAYVATLRRQRYQERTICMYLGSLAHFCHWMRRAPVPWATSNAGALVEQFLRRHLPTCRCPRPCYRSKANAGAALRHLLAQFREVAGAGPVTGVDPLATELQRFGTYLAATCGLAPSTCHARVRNLGHFLTREDVTQGPVLPQLTSARLEAFLEGPACQHLQHSSLRDVCSSVRSYFRYRTVCGDGGARVLVAALPRIADWRRATLPRVLSEAELTTFLTAFDQGDPVGMRDYAIARCLVDLGLRGCEATGLTFESIDWRQSIVRLGGTKSRRVQQLPLPAVTGAAIVRYLRHGRPPQATNRALFVRHRAPFDCPLGVAAIRNAMNRAWVRCGLRDRFCNTHVLRRTAATRLQRSGASVKEIADLLRHRDLDTAKVYARVDLDRLRAVTLPWPGSTL